MAITYEYYWVSSLLKLVIGLNPFCIQLIHKEPN